MNIFKVSYFASSFIFMLLSGSQSKPEIGDYIVDCSACNYLPLKGVDSYSCSVRCEVQDDVNMNLTGMFDMIRRLSEELEATKQRQLVTEKELNATREILNIDISFSATLSLPGEISFSAGDKIVFKNIISNVGDAYDSITGIFTAPYNGTYQFMVFSIGTTGTQWAWITFNGERLTTSHGSGSWVQGGTAVNKKLVVGDQVWIESQGADTFRGDHCIFTGNIIHVDF